MSGLDVDVDTYKKGVEPPFEYWERDHTALVHVLWGAKHEGLTLKDNADEIATRILRSRWLAAQRHHAANSDA